MASYAIRISRMVEAVLSGLDSHRDREQPGVTKLELEGRLENQRTGRLEDY